MGLIPKVTCRRCKNTYSSLRQRCPSCGTRRVYQSSRVPGTTPDTVKGTAANAKVAENRKWQLIFGAILIAAVIIAFIVMITVSVNSTDSTASDSRPDIPAVSANPTPVPTSSAAPEETPEITQLQIFYFSDDKTGSGFTATVGSKTPLIPRWYPQNLLDVEYSWSSSDESVATIGEDGVVEAVGTGTATITLTCYGMSVQTTVYVRG